MEEEIDLRVYIKVLIRHWKWIAALAVLAALVALVISSLLPATYEARAMVVITKPRYVMRFDPKFETVNDIQQPYKAYPALALSDDLLLETMTSIDFKEEQALASFRNKLKAVSGSDPSVVELIVTHRDAETAAHIANVWADVFIEQVDTLYNESFQNVGFFEEQLKIADDSLKKTEQALIDFQGQNRATVLSVQINASKEQLAAYWGGKNGIELVMQDAASLKSRLAMQEEDTPLVLADDLAALLLQIEALSLKSNVPLQLQVGGDNSISTMTNQDMVTFLRDLITTLETQAGELEIRITELEPEILRLQAELELFSIEDARLARAQSVAQDTYTTLARKVDEARIAAQDESGEIRLASSAAVPTRPVSPRKMVNTVIAGMLGLMLGVFGAFGIEWWLGESTEAMT